MADYLAGVVARATGAAETVHPRVPALFEPTALGAADAATANDRAVRPEPVEVEASSERARPYVQSPDPDHAPVRMEGPAAAVNTFVDAPRERIVQPEHPPAPAPVRDEPVQAVFPSPPVPTPRAERPGPAPTRARKRVPTPPAPAVTRPQTPATAPQQHGDVPQRLRTIVEEVLVPDGGPAPSQAPASPRPPGAIEAPSRRRRDTESALTVRPNLADGSSGETLVHVSIGRVEVSAPAAPPQPVSARRRPKPPTQLDEYLGRRNGTRR